MVYAVTTDTVTNHLLKQILKKNYEVSKRRPSVEQLGAGRVFV